MAVLGEIPWTSLRLTDVERGLLEVAAYACRFEPYDDVDRFARCAADAWRALTDRTRHAVSQVRSGTSVRPELYIENLPESPVLPPTPSTPRDWVPVTTDFISEFVTMVFVAGTGSPMSYRTERAGHIFHDVYPTVRNAAAVSSQSFRVELGFHTEMFFHPRPPDLLILHCLRPDPECAARTAIASMRDIEARLGPDERAVLRQPYFAIDLARLHSNYTYRGRTIPRDAPRPVIPLITDDPVSFRFEPELTTALGAEAAAALHATEEAAAEVAVSGVMRSGGLLIVDNRRAAHARSSFEAHLDGSDRWLRRVLVGQSESPNPAGIIRRDELELVDEWRPHAHRTETIAYVTH